MSPRSPYYDRQPTITSLKGVNYHGDWTPTQVLVVPLAQSEWEVRHRFPRHRSDRGSIPANHHECPVPRPLTPTNHEPSDLGRGNGYAGQTRKNHPLPPPYTRRSQIHGIAPNSCLRPEGTDRVVRWDVPAKHTQSSQATTNSKAEGRTREPTRGSRGVGEKFPLQPRRPEDTHPEDLVPIHLHTQLPAPTAPTLKGE